MPKKRRQAAPSSPVVPLKLIEQGRELERGGDLESAFERYYAAMSVEDDAPHTVTAAIECARLLWRSGDLDAAESLLTATIAAAASSDYIENKVEGRSKARGRLSLLLAQAGRDAEAARVMWALGCRYRLSRSVLHYALPPRTLGSSAYAPSSADAYVRVFDSALPPALLGHLQTVFADGGHFWAAHGYSEESNYFSYVHPLPGAQQPSRLPDPSSACDDSDDAPQQAASVPCPATATSLDELIEIVYAAALAAFPAVADATFVEW
jgi:hypothetical protein